MYRAFNTAVTGLKANQTKMEVIGNNIANVNTTGFKSNRATFEEQFAQTISGATAPSGGKGGVNAIQVGLGTRVASIDTVHTQGAINATGKNTDIALQGTGFLVLEDGSGNRLYSRDGNLSIDAEGSLVTNSGLRVQGYQADQKGVISANGDVTDLTIKTNRTYPPSSTTQVDVAGNLFRPARMTADQAFAHAIQNGVAASVTVTGYGNAGGELQLGTAAGNNTTNVLDAGELTINDVSIIGEVPLVANDNTQTVMQKL
ncbi:MAG: flagellar hook-basal body complex protein, partial [Candidatus Sericytochromatia bacterium]